MQQLVSKAFNSQLTESEKEFLIKNYPEVAADLPDNSSRTSRIVVSPTIMATRSAATTRCNTYTGWNSLKSLLGFTIYKFTHSATVCSNGSKIVSHSKPTYKIDDADITVDSWVATDSRVTGIGTSNSQSRIQVRVKQCVVKYGCYANHYPTGTISARANNTADINTSNR